MKAPVTLILTMLLLASGCDDSKNPLSSPEASKLDERLLGIWRYQEEDGEVVYYHVGQAGEKFPGGMMRIITVRHERSKVDSPEECLAFSTSLGDKDYLNVVLEGDKKQVKLLNEKGWNADAVDGYTLVKYQVDGDKTRVWLTDDDAKKAAIRSGKIKGVIEANKPTRFTDSTENVARFVVEADKNLFKSPEKFQFERVKTNGR